jgi:hypothetical protein
MRRRGAAEYRIDMRHRLLHTISSLFFCDTQQAPSPLLTPHAGRAGSEPFLVQPAGCGQTRKEGRPASYPRRCGPGSWARSGTANWQWGADGKLKFKKTMTERDWPEVIPVVPPAAVITREQGRHIWIAMAPISAGRSPFTRLFPAATVQR